MNMLYSLIRKIYYRLRAIKTRISLNGLISRGLSIGEECQLTDIESIFLDPSHCFLISIGNRCIVAPNVRFIAHDASTKLFLDYTKFARIDIKDNTFIGDSSIILPGVTIGPNAIVAAGAVVTKDVPPNSIVAGNPAKVIANLDEYLARIEAIKKRKRVFDESYFIEHLTEEKKRELLDSIGQDFGFIK